MSSNQDGPLAGVKVLDFTWFGVGPYSTLMLAFMGADCVRVESQNRPDAARHGKGKPDMLGRTFGTFTDLSMNKRSITINLKHPDAANVVLALVEHFDLVAESFRPGVMERLGIGYDELKKRRPDLIMLSSSAHGTGGPDSNLAGYAPIFAALGGLGYISGYRNGPPMEIRHSMDMASGLMCSFAVLTALLERQRSGRGQHIDIAARETASCLMGHVFTEFGLTGRGFERCGNDEEGFAPHNCYPCQGIDRWISIAVVTEDHWSGLVRAMSSPAWAQESRFEDSYRRWLNRDDLDRLIAEWTHAWNVSELWQVLQAHGVPSSPSFDSRQLVEDPHLKDRGVFQTVAHDGTQHTVVGSPFRFSATPGQLHSPPPRLGADTSAIIGELLGWDSDAVTRMTEEGLLV